MWTKWAEKSKLVRVEPNGEAYWDDVPYGTYIATGQDIDNRPIRSEYTVNGSDRNSIWAMWHDFCGRSGLTRIWFVDDSGNRHLVWREY